MRIGTVVMLAVIALVSGCGKRDQRFETKAIYQAPQSGFELVIFASGVIPEGSDISETAIGTATVVPIGAQKQSRAVLHLGEEGVVGFVLGDEPIKIARWDFRTDESTLRSILEQAGYGSLMDEEIAESVQAIGGVMAGPKGTRLKGQTEHLNVVDVNARYQ